MKLLLDTHIWVWSVDRPRSLSREILRHLQNPKNELYLSPISIWEAQHLHRRGRMQPRGSFSEWLDHALSLTPLSEAPLNFAVAREAARIRLPHDDPGDLFLAATASVYELTLVTADTQLIACSWLKTLTNK